MKFIILIPFILILLLSSCKKGKEAEPIPPEPPAKVTPTIKEGMDYPVSLLESLSDINKTTSWYNTNKSFTELFTVSKSLYWGFEKTDKELIPYNTSTTDSWSKYKEYYFNEIGMYIYTDLTGDGKKDLYAYYLKEPWPTNARGLSLFSEYEKQPTEYDVQLSLTVVRKSVLADVNNDKFPEIVQFSSGYDAMPFPGDSLGIFYPREKRYQYLGNKIGYFHGGATGDINNDGYIDIVAYPFTVYINDGKGLFTLSNNIIKGSTGIQGFSTVELFDIDQDGKLDLLLSDLNIFIIILQKNGQFNVENAISIPIDKGLQIMDMAFFDFNKDGKNDILTMNNKDVYTGYDLRLYINENNNFKDVTTDYFDVFAANGNDAWIAWIHLFDYDKDGDIDVVADGLFGPLKGVNGRRIWWRDDGKGIFTRVRE